MATIDNLSLSITAQATDATKKIDALSNALKGFKGSANLSSAVNNLTKLKEALSALNRIKVNDEKLSGISAGIKSINDSISGISTTNVRRVERLATALQSLGMVRQISQSARSAIQESLTQTQPQESGTETRTNATEPAGETANAMREASTETQRATRRLFDFRGAIVAIARVTGATLSRSLTAPFRALGRVIQSITRPLTSLIRSIGRIAMYRMLRSIIKSITSGIKEGIQNLAMFSKLMNELDSNKANRVMSLLTSNFLYLKNALATAVIPILKALEPVIDNVINRLVDFINVVAQLFSALTGSSTYTRAKYFYVDYAESIDKASGSASKLNKQLAKFDELNNLTTHEGGGSSATDYLSMFEDPVPIADWIQKLKDFIANGDWYSFGQSISLKIRDTLRGIDWDKIGDESARRGSGLAGFFNGLIRPDTAYEIGKALVGVVNTAFRFFNSWASTMDWVNVGTSFASFLNGIIENAKPEELADAINNMVQAFLDFAGGFFENFNWKEALEKMFNVLSDISPEAYAIILGSFLTRTFALAGTTAGTDYGQSLGSAIVAGLGGYLIGNGLGQIWASIIGDQDMLETYQQANPFTADTKLGNSTYDFWETVFDFWKVPSGKDIMRGSNGGLTVDVFKLSHGDFYKAKKDIVESYHKLGLTTEDAIKDFNNYVSTGELPSFLSDETKATIEEYKKYAEFLDEPAYVDAFAEIGRELDALNGKQNQFTEPTLWEKFKEKVTEVGLEIYGEDGFWVKFYKKAVEVEEALDGVYGIWHKIKAKATEVGEAIYGSDGFWDKVADKATEIGIAIYGNNGFWDKVENKATKVGTAIYGNGGFWDKVANKATEIGISIYGNDGFWAKIANKATEVGTAIYGEGGFWSKVKDECAIVGMAIYGNDGFWAKFKTKSTEVGQSIYGTNGFWSKFNLSAEQAWQLVKSGWNALKASIANDPIRASVIITQTVQTIKTGAEAGISAYETIIEGGTNPTPTTTPAPTSAKTWHNLPSKPSGMPESSWASYLANWKKQHPEMYYAHGGFPTAGSMFIAGEAGAELVGNFNGRTGVANTDQIVEAMYTATYDAMSTALAENPSRFIIEGDADGMFRIMQQKANNFFTRTGRTAF